MRMLYLFFLACSFNAWTAESDPILGAVEKYAREIASHSAVEVQIETGPFDTSRLPSCSLLETYSPPGIRKLGRTHVGVRCKAPQTWNVLVPVRIVRVGDYLTAQRPILQQNTIKANDVSIAHGELPESPVTASNNAIGKTVTTPIRQGQAIRADQLRALPTIRQGQIVRVLVQGPGYQVKSEGKAINDGVAGDTIRVRMATGKTIVGVAQVDGSVLLEY